MIEKRWLKISDLAEYLSLSVGHVRNKINDGTFPYSKSKGIGIRFDRLKIDAMLEEAETATTESQMSDC